MPFDECGVFLKLSAKKEKRGNGSARLTGKGMLICGVGTGKK